MTDRTLSDRTVASAESAKAPDSSSSHTPAPLRTAVPLAGLVSRSATGTADPLGGTEAAPEVTSVLRRRRGQGRALDRGVADRFGEAYGSDLSSVRVHDDAESNHIARSVQATAFTHGTDVYFSAGTYSPGSQSGEKLLAHELAHVAQHQRGEFGATGGGTTIGRAHDPAETAADQMAAGALGPLRRKAEQAPVHEHSDVGHGGAPLRRLRNPFRSKAGELDNLKNYKKEDGTYDGAPIGKFSGKSSASKRKEVEKLKSRETEKSLHQPVADLGEIYAHTAMLGAAFEDEVRKIAASTHGEPSFREANATKSVGRSLEKIATDYGGDRSRIIDTMVGSIAFKGPEELIYAFGAVRTSELFKVVRIKNSLAEDKGYGDINLSLEMGGADFEVEVDGVKKTEHYAGYIVELQLHLAPIMAAKEHAHADYEEQRSIDAKYKSNKDKSTWADTDREKWQSLQAKMVKTYGEAWSSLGDTAAIKKGLGVAIQKMDVK